MITKLKAIWWVITGANRFRVKYLDGSYSVLMPYSSADICASVFGGEVIIYK